MAHFCAAATGPPGRSAWCIIPPPLKHHAQTFIPGRPCPVWSTRRRECYDVSDAGAWSFNINASIRSAILCAGSRNCPMVQSAA